MSCRKRWRMFHAVKGSIGLPRVRELGPSLEMV